jgi:hypothetical protein
MNSFDVYIKKCLRNTATRQKPPREGRERLISAATYASNPSRTRENILRAIIRSKSIYPIHAYSPLDAVHWWNGLFITSGTLSPRSLL